MRHRREAQEHIPVLDDEDTPDVPREICKHRGRNGTIRDRPANATAQLRIQKAEPHSRWLHEKMEPLRKYRAVVIDAIAEDHFEKFSQYSGVLFDKFGTNRQWYLPGKTLWPGVGVKIGTDRDESGPVFQRLDLASQHCEICGRAWADQTESVAEIRSHPLLRHGAPRAIFAGLLPEYLPGSACRENHNAVADGEAGSAPVGAASTGDGG